MPKKSGCSEPSSKCVSKGAAERWLNDNYRLTASVSSYSSNRLIPVRSWVSAFQDLTNMYVRVEGSASWMYGTMVFFSTKEGKHVTYRATGNQDRIRYSRGDRQMSASDKIVSVSVTISGINYPDPSSPTRVRMYSDFSSDVEYSGYLTGDGSDSANYNADCELDAGSDFVIYADIERG